MKDNDRWDELKDKIINLRGLATIGLSDISGNIITMFFWFYIAATLEPIEYGKIQYLLSIVGITFSIVLIGTQNTITVYSAKKIRVQPALYSLSLIGGVIGFLTLYYIFNKIDIGLLLFGYIISSMVIGDLLGRKLYSNYSKYIMIQKSLTLVLGIGFYHLFGLNGILYALALSYVPFIVEIYKTLKISKIDFTLIRSNANFISNNYAISLTSGFNSQIDRIIIASLIGIAFIGSYSLALQTITILTMTNEIFFKYLLAQDASGIKNMHLKKYIILISILTVVITVLFAPQIIPVVFPKYVDVVNIIQIMSFSIIPSTLTMIMSSQLLGKKNNKFVLFGMLSSLTTLIIGIIGLGLLFGPQGIAFAFVLSATVNTIYLFYGSHKLKKSS